MTEQGVTVPAVPPLATLPGVELVQAGQWDISTGRVTFTTADLAAAVGALDCPAVRRPVLKLGHTDPRFDGEPAVGWVANMALADGGNTIVGDYAGMPGWLGDVIASAYPDRSIEGCFDFRCQLGHTHPFVIDAVALLGVTAPGVGTLESLQDVAALYGVTASGSPAGHRVAVTIHASRKDTGMPNPQPLQISAAVTSEDVRRQYYESAPWSVWITEMQLEPLQLIVTDDDTGQYARIPITLDGETITFGSQVPVQIQYIDRAPDTTGGAADSVPAAASRGLVYASRVESRPGPRPAAAPAPIDSPPAPAAGASPAQEGAAMDAALLREDLGLPPEATDDDVREALAASGYATPTDDTQTAEETGDVAEDVAAATQAQTLPDGVVTIDQATLDQLRHDAAQGVAARAQQRTEARDTAINAAISEGRIPPARRTHWATLWDADPDGTRTTLASLAAGTVPLTDIGTPGGSAEAAVEAEFAEFDKLFRPTTVKEA